METLENWAEGAVKAAVPLKMLRNLMELGFVKLNVGPNFLWPCLNRGWFGLGARVTTSGWDMAMINM